MRERLPPTRRFSTPTSLPDAILLLSEDPEARCFAGGAGLVPAMNAGGNKPGHLVSLRKIPGLTSIETGPDRWLEIGAMVTHARVAKASADHPGLALVSETAAQIAHPTIRNMGTIGGSMASAEFNADYPCALLANGAVIRTIGKSGQRDIPIDEFLVSHMQTSLRPDEIITQIRIPPPAARGNGTAYIKFSRVDGDYALACISVRVQLDGNGLCTAARLAVGGCAPRPYRIAEADQLLLGSDLNAAATYEAAKVYAARANPKDDIKGTASYRKRILPGLIERAVALAKKRALGANG